MTRFHLAQLNIAQEKYDMESQDMAGFVARLDKINQLNSLRDSGPSAFAFNFKNPFPQPAAA